MDFEAVINDFKKQITDLQAENTQLRQENARLKEQLGLNSKNSSLPPSRDIYKIKRTTRVKSNRSPGAQPGHKPQGYERRVADETIDVVPTTCACGQALEAMDSFHVHQKIEIPPIKPYVTDYRLHHGYCPVCRKKRIAPLPQGVEAGLLGDNAKVIIGALGGFFHQSKKQIQHLLSTVFNLFLSVGLISHTEKRISLKLAPFYQGLTGSLRESPYLHVDETGHKSKGKRGWAWIVTTHDRSLLKLAASRGRKVLQTLLPAYKGWVISDRYSAYTYFTPAQRQVCWAHLKRDFERFAHSQDIELAKLGRQLVLLTRQVFAWRRACQNKVISELAFCRQLRKRKKRMHYLLKRVLGVPDIIQAHRVAKNLLKAFDMMWRFADHPELEPTNNLAERQIRKYVIYRKTCMFTWSQRGNEYIERIMSLYLTARLQKQNPFLQLSNLIAQPL